jgi:hypothetical protein
MRAGMMNAERPLGVILLSFFSYLASCALVVLCAKDIFAFATQVGLPLIGFHEEPRRYLAALVAIMVFFSCLLTLAGIEFIAGLDLWPLRARGRRLTVASMILVLVFGGVLLFTTLTEQSGTQEKIIASAMCVISLTSLLYLFLPKVKQRF